MVVDGALVDGGGWWEWKVRGWRVAVEVGS